MKLEKLIKSVIVLTTLSLACAAQAAPATQMIPYYGEEFYRDLKSGISDKDLQLRLKTVLRSYHQSRAGSLDQIVKACQGGQGKCYAHQAIGYTAARVFLLGNYYLVKDGNNGYAVHDVYCDTDRTRNDFRGSPPAPGKIPDNNVINVEHTWPQSHFTRKHPDDVQKSDLHHLFPTDSQLNSIRGNNMFGEVSKDLLDLKCPASRYGIGTAGSEEVFEPPKNHQGNVARALFYFSIRYDLPIDPREENVLRKWNHEDPVDEEEMRRNNEIFKVQGNRNPFVDYQELADRISDF
ncbi:endonuclease [Bdellovibrio sp. 22V]|uniref:endonuclease I family protein n=1 Tax=Bdellovibrio TaxID=958 RepID=UPI0025430F10|nr:endonuclease [Bdellovibrio sp. 22V]WII73915.1 endonuclease [Bdellovibrio sp. 22V]